MGRSHIHPFIVLVLFGLLSICLPKSAQAFEGVAGWEGDATPLGYAFLTAGFDVPTSQKSAAAIRVTGSYLYYDLSNPDSSTSVRSPGVSLIGGPKFILGGTTISALVGLEYRWTKRDSTYSSRRFRDISASWYEGDVAFVVHGLTYANLSRFTSGMILLSYNGGNQYVFSRLSLKRQISNTSFKSPRSIFAGFDATLQGNQEIRTTQLGLLVEMSLMQGHLSFGLRGGVKRSWLTGGTTEDGLYIGTSLFTHW